MKYPAKVISMGMVILASSFSLLVACSSSYQEEPVVMEQAAPQSISPTAKSARYEPSAMADVIRENYVAIEENKQAVVASQPVSTFSIDVDTASYSNMRRFIMNGHLPPVDAVRIEEMVNYFDYSYAAPKNNEIPFQVTTEVGPTPWNTNNYLLHVGIKGYQPQQDEQPARNLVFLIDVSGSMSSPNKLGLLKKSLRLLVKQLNGDDRVAIVVYAGSSGLVLPSTQGNRGSEIVSALERLSAGGSTNGGAGIELAYAIAEKHFIDKGVNRVILATDGDFNVGPSSTGDLKHLIKQKKQTGVGLTILGLGMGNYNDAMLEEISNAGDGNAAYIDTLKEAQKVLVTDMGGTLHTIARDTKIQIEFNPQLVSSYRLIGYENRMLKREDFKNDRVDAGDVGAGHTVTAIYEITPNEALRYQRSSEQTTAHANELGMLKIRYKRPGEQSSRELAHTILKSDMNNDLDQTSDNFRFSAAVAGFGQLLRHSEYIDGYTFDEVYKLASDSRGKDNYGYRSEFLQLVKLAESLE